MEMAAVVAWARAHGKSKSAAYSCRSTFSNTPALLVVRSRDMTHEGYLASYSPMIRSHAIFGASYPVRLQ